MAAYANELEENFTPKDTKRDTAQTILPRNVVKRFANRRSDSEGWMQFAFHCFFILGSQFMIYMTNPKSITNPFAHMAFYVLNWMALIFCGYTISFVFHGLHECVHHTAFKSPWANDAVAYFFGFTCFRPPMHYRYYHWAHHRFTGDKGKDPELQSTFIDFDISGSLFKYFVYLTGIPFWIDRVTAFTRHSLVFFVDNILSMKMSPKMHAILLPPNLEYYLQRKQRRYNVSAEAFMFVCVYSMIWLVVDHGVLWTYWILPSLIGQVFLRMYLIAEHRECASNTNMFSNTRTTKTSWLTTKLAWYMPYHLEHHAFPYVPFYLLPEIHDLLVEYSGGNEQFFGKSGCTPDGQDGYLSVHKQLLQDVLSKER